MPAGKNVKEKPSPDTFRVELDPNHKPGSGEWVGKLVPVEPKTKK